MANLLNLNLILNPILNDSPEPWQLGFQDSAAPGFEGIIDLHDSIFFYLVIIFQMNKLLLLYYNR